jgi:hypothetical protein
LNSTNDAIKSSQVISHLKAKFLSSVLMTVSKMMDTNSPMTSRLPKKISLHTIALKASYHILAYRPAARQ